MMSVQMLSASGSLSAGTVADLAPGAKDGMRLLEAKAAEMSVGGGGGTGGGSKQGNSILFVRGETHVQTKAGLDAKVINPEEIDIDDDYEEEEEDEGDGEGEGEDDDGKAYGKLFFVFLLQFFTDDYYYYYFFLKINN